MEEKNKTKSRLKKGVRQLGAFGASFADSSLLGLIPDKYYKGLKEEFPTTSLAGEFAGFFGPGGSAKLAGGGIKLGTKLGSKLIGAGKASEKVVKGIDKVTKTAQKFDKYSPQKIVEKGAINVFGKGIDKALGKTAGKSYLGAGLKGATSLSTQTGVHELGTQAGEKLGDLNAGQIDEVMQNSTPEEKQKITEQYLNENRILTPEEYLQMDKKSQEEYYEGLSDYQANLLDQNLYKMENSEPVGSVGSATALGAGFGAGLGVLGKGKKNVGNFIKDKVGNFLRQHGTHQFFGNTTPKNLKYIMQDLDSVAKKLGLPKNEIDTLKKTLNVEHFKSDTFEKFYDFYSKLSDGAKAEVFEMAIKNHFKNTAGKFKTGKIPATQGEVLQEVTNRNNILKPQMKELENIAFQTGIKMKKSYIKNNMLKTFTPVELDLMNKDPKVKEIMSTIDQFFGKYENNIPLKDIREFSKKLRQIFTKEFDGEASNFYKNIKKRLLYELDKPINDTMKKALDVSDINLTDPADYDMKKYFKPGQTEGINKSKRWGDLQKEYHIGRKIKDNIGSKPQNLYGEAFQIRTALGGLNKFGGIINPLIVGGTKLLKGADRYNLIGKGHQLQREVIESQKRKGYSDKDFWQNLFRAGAKQKVNENVKK